MTVTNYLKFLILTLMCLFIGASFGLAATVYVDAANEGGTEDGTSWATAWGTIQEGVDDTNFSGSTGNTVLVASGTYNERVNLTSTHSGASSSLNAIVSSGTVTVNGTSYCFYFSGASYIRIDGFKCTGATSYGIPIYDGSNYNKIENCVVYSNGDEGIKGNNSTSNTIENCVVYGNSSYGIYTENSATFTVKNSIVNNNVGYGLMAGGGTTINDSYNNVYANRTNYYGCSAGVGSISENPGFVHPYNNDFYLFSDSPCVGAGESGVDMGAYPTGPTTPVSSNTYYIDGTSGLDTNDGSEAFPWKTIQHAADTMTAGDTVIIKPDTYTEQILITKGGTELSPITYKSSGTVIVNGAGNYIKLSTASYVRIEGLELTSLDNGVILENSFDNTISSCAIHDNTNSGIYFKGYSFNNIVDYNNIYSNGANGISLYIGPKNNTIQNCKVYDNVVEGIYLYNSDNNIIQDCDIYNNIYGIYLYSGSDNNIIRRSSIYKNESRGIYARAWSDNTVEGCVVYGNEYLGIYGYDNSSFVVKNSIIVDNNGTGLAADGTSSITATYNNVYANKTNYSGCSAGAGSISENPGFVHPYNGDFHIYSDSPCIGAGESGVDMGAYPTGPTTPVSSNTYYVDGVSGLDTNDGSEAFPWKTIQHAADNMMAGDTVIIKPDTYTEDVLITKGGTPSSPVTYKSSGTVGVDGVSYGFKLDNVSGIHIEEIDFPGGEVGISMEYAYDNTISSCNIRGGLQLNQSHENKIIGNDVYDGSDGIYLYESTRNTIQDCDIYNNYNGINLNYYSKDNNIKYCNIYDHDGRGIYAYRYSANTIESCVIYASESHGVYANEYITLTVKNSIIVNNGTYGMGAYNDSSIIATYNDVYGNRTNYYGCSPGAGSISENPGFVCPYNGDFHLYSDSPCVGTGEGGVDMGFYPSGPTTPISSNTYYVDGNSGLDTNDGSQAFPWKTIQHAADTMIAGDTVIVLPDTYYEQVSIVKGGTSNNPITYRSSGTVVVNGSANCFRLDNVSNVIIEGFKLTSTTDAVYLFRSYDNTIHSCDIYENSYGIYLGYVSSNNTIQYCNIYRNQYRGIYGYNDCFSNKIYNCVIYDNDDRGIYADRYTSFTVYNTIVSSNSIYGLRTNDNSTITDDYNDVCDNGTDYYGCSAGANSISQDPRFVSTVVGNEDFHLKSDSPCIGTGKPNPTLRTCIGTYDVYNTLTDDYASATTTHKITFTTGNTIFGIDGSIPSDGKIRITYPSGFDLTGIDSVATSTSMDGSFSVNVSAQVVTITRSGGTATTSGETEDISIDDVVNHATTGDYTIYWETLDNGGSTIEGPVKSNNFEVYFDTIPPAAVDDLTATTSGSLGGAIDLTWTAPKEDGNAGGAVTSYDVRYATISFTDADWDASWISQATGEPSPPKSPGEIENFIVGGLDSLTTYYFAIKSFDDVDNPSPIDTKTATLNQANAMASDNTPTAPVVTVIYPNGGEICVSTVTITWTYSDYNVADTHTFDIKLSTDGGTNYAIIVSSELPDGTTYYAWNTKRHPNGPNNMIKVIATDSGSLSGEDESDGIFGIINPNEPPVVTVIAPNGGEYWAYDIPEIIWTYTDPNGADTHTFDIWVSSDGGASWGWQEASGLGENSSPYTWNTYVYPNGTDYRIKIVATDDGNPIMTGEDASDGSFSINNDNESPTTFSLLSPANGNIQNKSRPTFDWEDATDPDISTGDIISYTLWYSTNKDFTPHTEISGLTVSQWKLTTDLNDDTVYYWKVRVQDSLGLWRWSNQTNWYLTINRRRITSDDGNVYVVMHSGLPDNGYVDIDKKTTANSSSIFLAHQETRSNPLLKVTSNSGYDINVYNNVDDSLLSNVTLRATITMYYDDEDDDDFLDGTKIQEEYLRIFRLNGGEKRWELVDGEQTRNETNNSVSADVNQFSTYALFAYVRPTGVLCKASNYPNPFAAGEESTTISYILTKDSKVTIRIYNLVGDLVREMEFEEGEEGGIGQKVGYNNRIEWDGRNGDSMKVSNGAYICQIIAEPEDGSGEQEEVRKIGVLK